jgi:hypothetical protein
MTTIIKDGTGSGNTARVSDNNHLAVDSVNVSEIAHISSVDAKAYQFQFERTLLAAATDEVIGLLTYLGEHKLQIETLYLSREDVSLASGSQAVVEVYSEPTYTSGGASITPTNLNIGSSNLPTATAYSGTTTLVIDTTSAVEVLDVVFAETVTIHFAGSIVLDKGTTIAIKGKSKNIGDIIHANVLAYEVTEVI